MKSSSNDCEVPRKHIVSALAIRHLVLDQAKRANVGHIGSAFSIAEILEALYGRILQCEDPNDPDRDRLILSKGHAALALYSALYLKGWIDDQELNSYCTDGTLLGTHPEAELQGVDFCTGSLGHGICYGVGAALGAKIAGSKRRVYVIVSDAECNEGSLWEAVMVAAHYKLENLSVVVDLNGQQAMGYTKDVLNLEFMERKWSAFNWAVTECNGHDASALVHAVKSHKNARLDKPQVILARTTAGKGVSFMEGTIKWHYWPMSDAEYKQAKYELGSQE